jgi:hypothetical protein
MFTVTSKLPPDSAEALGPPWSAKGA